MLVFQSQSICMITNSIFNEKQPPFPKQKYSTKRDIVFQFASLPCLMKPEDSWILTSDSASTCCNSESPWKLHHTPVREKKVTEAKEILTLILKIVQRKHIFNSLGDFPVVQWLRCFTSKAGFYPEVRELRSHRLKIMF